MTTDEIGVGVLLEIVPEGTSFRCFRRMRLLTVCASFTDLSTENMSELDCSKGKWKLLGEDLETALQSQEALSCTT
jgi:hypothetical protein